VLSTNVRIVAATNADLPSLAEAGKFRWDLLDRLSFDVITLPPLRARDGDKSLLADFFARRLSVELAEDFPGFAPSAIAAIEAHDWPGNVRELRNFAERLTHRALTTSPNAPVAFDPAALDPFASPWRPSGTGGGAVQKPSIKPAVEPPDLWSVPGGFSEAVGVYEQRLIDAALARAQGHQGRAAEALGLTYHQLRGLLKKHGYAKAVPREL
jgi:psp operon transcriptional activator